MDRWTGIVLASAATGEDRMQSRLPAGLHPIAGRPLVWHTVSLLTQMDPPPERVVVLSAFELSQGVFSDLSVPVEVVSPGQQPSYERDAGGTFGTHALVVDAAASAPLLSLQALLGAPSGTWLSAGPEEAVAAWVDRDHFADLLRLRAPLRLPNDVLLDGGRLPDRFAGSLVNDRIRLAEAVRRVRDGLVQRLMAAGVTFLLPDSVVIDVDVRVGCDSVIYPGVVLEGQTTIGEETVVGPGCRIIDSWVGSGVELKGWNYVAHTSIRNRAILEPYVRRGFD